MLCIVGTTHLQEMCQSNFFAHLNMNDKKWQILIFLSDCNWTWTQNHLVRKRTLN